MENIFGLGNEFEIYILASPFWGKESQGCTNFMINYLKNIKENQLYFEYDQDFLIA